MTLYAPNYYKRFSCIADRCRHSCCIGWEIDVDDDTLARYKALSGGYGACIQKSIDESGDTPHFRLTKDERCPHLDERGLCRIILSLGEGYLCDICREHPRFYHETAHGVEVGIGMACEEAARLILSADDYAELVPIESMEGEPLPLDFDVTPHRKRLFDLLASTASYEDKLRCISETYQVSPRIQSDADWRALLNSLEYLDERHRALLSAYTSDAAMPPAAQQFSERALAYWIYRHATPSNDPGELRAALGLCLFLERLFCSLLSTAAEIDLPLAAETARMLSEELEYSEQNTEAIRAVFE